MAVVDNSFIVKKVQSRSDMIVAYCAWTNMPLVVCDPETYNDQVWIFETEEQLQNFAKPYTERRILLRGMKYENKDFLHFFSSLFTMDVNELVFVDENGDTKIELEQLVRKPDYSKLDPRQVPVTNPALQLTAMYFMQEAKRPVKNEEKTDLRELEEELSSNLLKSRYLIAVEMEEGEGSVAEKLKNHQYRIPILKNKEEDVYQPIFTDPIEFQKFAQNKNTYRALAVPFAQLETLLVKDAKGYMLNPRGYQLLMPKELLAGLPKRFGVSAAAVNPASTVTAQADPAGADE